VHPQTLGEHLLKRRLYLQLSVQEVAVILNTSLPTLRSWENNQKKPRIRDFSHITTFLGYSLWQFDSSSLEARMKEYRFKHGLSANKFAGLIGVSETAILKWEAGKTKPSETVETKLHRVLEKQTDR